MRRAEPAEREVEERERDRGDGPRPQKVEAEAAVEPEDAAAPDEFHRDRNRALSGFPRLLRLHDRLDDVGRIYEDPGSDAGGGVRGNLGSHC